MDSPTRSMRITSGGKSLVAVNACVMPWPSEMLRPTRCRPSSITRLPTIFSQIAMQSSTLMPAR